MIITVINGNTNPKVSDGIKTAAELASFTGTQIRMVTPEMGPNTIEGYLEAEISAVGVCEEIARWRHDSDAFVIACYSDPGLAGGREIAAQPVIGIAEASMVTAVQLGHSFSLLSPRTRMRPVLSRLAFQHGFRERFASVQTVDMSVIQAAEPGEARILAFQQAGQRAIEQDGAEVLILAGAVLAGLEIELSKRLGVPVLDPVKCAMVQAQGMVLQNLRTSKIGGYASPLPKKRLNCPPNLTAL